MGYKIWDKVSNIYTPSGAVFSPEEWMENYGWINIPGAVPVVSDGLVNGAYFNELGEMKKIYQGMGAVFDEGLTDEEVLGVIDAFEANLSTASSDSSPSAEERIAAALEYQNLLAE